MPPTDREMDLVLSRLDKFEERLEKHGTALDSIVEQLASAKGGVAVLRTLAAFCGITTLGGVLSIAASVGGWFRSH